MVKIHAFFQRGTVIQNVSKMGLNLDSVFGASRSSTTLRPAGGHPWAGVSTGPGRATRRASISFVLLIRIKLKIKKI
jgi:hypothetical protein